MSQRTRELVKEIRSYSTEMFSAAPQAQTRQTAAVAELLATLAEDAERMTRWIICLTWALVILTAALLAYTKVLYKDTHQLVERERQTQHDALQNSKLPP